MRKALGLAVASVLPFWLAGAFLTQTLTSTHTTSARDASLVESTDGMAGLEDLLRGSAGSGVDEEGPIDLLGNPVSPAVATYKFDATGSLYETHSPQTELPRLASPKT